MLGEEEGAKRAEEENEKRISHKNVFWFFYRLLAEKEITEDMLFRGMKK